MPRYDRQRAAERVALDYAATDAVVTVGLAAAARARGGALVATTAELHAIEGRGAPWPASVGEMAADTLPRLAARPGARGLTVRLLRAGPPAAMLWEVRAAALPAPAPKLAARPIAVQPAPVAPRVPSPVAPQPRGVATGAYLAGAAGLVVPSDAEFDRVAAAARAASTQRLAQRKADIAAEKRAIEHADNLRLLRGRAA